MKNLIIMLCVSLLLAACVATPPAKEEGKPPVQAGSTKPGADTGTTAMTIATTDTAALTESAKAAQQQGLQDKSIYFDIDTFLVKSEYRGLLQQHVGILNRHRKDTVTLEGNADERGSAEYNLAIGNKRAHAVKVQLIALGIEAVRINEVSYGEEKPRATCHEESCWQQNRRVDVVYRSSP